MRIMDRFYAERGGNGNRRARPLDQKL